MCMFVHQAKQLTRGREIKLKVLYMHNACLRRRVQVDVVSSAGHVSLGAELQEHGSMVSRLEQAPIQSAQSMADECTCLGPSM